VPRAAARRAAPRVPRRVHFHPPPHRRTAHSLAAGAEALRSADRVVVADDYGARRHVDGERRAGAPELVIALRRRGVAAEEGGGPRAAAARFAAALPAEAAAFVLGAGDIEEVREELLAALAARAVGAGSAGDPGRLAR
jgi:UDP-N-acetylmuramate-alanine ligase